MISAIILVKDQLSQLSTALNSVRFCDEILVIDDYSTQDITPVTKPYGAKVYHRHLDQDYAAQRNFALSKATKDWVLFVDADEIVTPSLQQEILNVTTTNTNIEGFYLYRQDVFLDKVLQYGETSQVTLLRLARKNSGRWARPVHEIWNISGPTEKLHHPLIHQPHATISKFITKINFYTNLEAQYRIQQQEQFSLIKLVLFPPLKFFHNYLFKLGFLDGFPGLVMAFIMSLHSLILRVKLYEK